MTKFNQWALDQIKADSQLFEAVADALGIKPVSLPMALQRNGASLNQYSIVTLVATHLGKEPEELLEKDTENIKEESANGS